MRLLNTIGKCMAYNLWTLIQDTLQKEKKPLPVSFDEYLIDTPEEAYALIQALNSTLAKLCNSGDFEFRKVYSTIAVLEGIQSYTLPYGKLDLVRHSDSFTDMTFVDYDSKILGRVETAKPYTYGIKGSSIYFYPIPDDDYTITISYFTNKFAKSSTNVPQQKLEIAGDVPLLPEDCKWALIYGALADQYEKVNRAKYIHWISQYKLHKGDIFKYGVTSVQNAPISFDSGITTNW